MGKTDKVRFGGEYGGLLRTFGSNLFGAIAGLNGAASYNRSGANFIPYNSLGQTITLTGPGSALWMGMSSSQQQKKAYELCYPVASVIDRLAEYDTTGCLEIIRLKGKGADDLATNSWATKMNARLTRPNPLQSWEQFRGQQVAYKKIFGWCVVFPVIPAGFGPEFCTSMINLPPWLCEPITTGKIAYATSADQIITGWRVNLLGESLELKASQVFVLEDSFIADDKRGFVVPKSRLEGLDMAISNICKAMEAANVLLAKRGPMGFISHDAAATKDSVAGYIPMEQEEREELQKDLSQYGLSYNQYQYAISRTAVKWNPTSYDVKQLGIDATVVSGEKAICHRYGFPYVLYEETDATYANGSNASVRIYQDNVIPNANKDMNRYNDFFKAADNNCSITLNYNHLPVLKEDQRNEQQANFFQSQALTLDFNNNMLTVNEYRQLKGWDLLGPEQGDKFYRDMQKEQQQLEPQQQNNNSDGNTETS